MTVIFEAPHTLAIVEARLAHLESLNLPLAGRKALEVGAGVGNLTGWFVERGCTVVSTDGREENVREHQRRFPDIPALVVDLDEPGSHLGLGTFDLVVCYGVLYHVRDPRQVLTDLAAVCSGMLLVETEVHGQDDWGIYRLDEGAGLDQSLCGYSVRYGRGLILRFLERDFPYVYLSTTQPKHEWFPVDWPSATEQARAVFVASHEKIDSLYLSTYLVARMDYAG